MADPLDLEALERLVQQTSSTEDVRIPWLRFTEIVGALRRAKRVDKKIRAATARVPGLHPGNVSDLEAVLERISELERDLEAERAYLKHAEAISDNYRNRAERVEAKLRELDEIGTDGLDPGTLLWLALMDIETVLAPVSGEEGRR